MAKQCIAKYIRLSQEDAKTDSFSLENQRLLLDRYILESDMSDGNVLEFVDNGYTGTNFERPGVQELLELVRNGKVSCIVVKDFSRFGRNALETGYFIERVFPLYRVRFISVYDGFDSFTLDGDTGGMEVAFKFLINEHYSRDLSAKIRSAKHEKALRGEAVSKNCAFGYMLDDNRNMVIDPEAAETVQLIFHLYGKGERLIDIIKQLYEERRLIPSACKKQKRALAKGDEFTFMWNKCVVLKILQDEQYTGVYVAGKTKTKEVGNPNRAPVANEDWIRIPCHHTPIIQQKLFDTVQERLRVKGEVMRKRELHTGIRYTKYCVSLLKGKVFCGCCGHAMQLSCTKNAAFHCTFTRSVSNADCHKLRVLKSDLESIVLKNIQRQAKHIMASGCLSADVGIPEFPAVAEHEAMIEHLQYEKQRLYEALVTGDICQDEYKAKKATIDTELNRTHSILEVIRTQYAKSAFDAVAVEAAKLALENKTLTQELSDILIDRVLVYPNNRIEISWKLAGFANHMSQTAEHCVTI